MQIEEIPVPEIYKSSSDFRFFLKWYGTLLDKIKYDTENLIDVYDPLRCPAHLLWMLAETMGFKYDDRLPSAFNRLVLVYFMSMIRNRGSKDGVTLAAEVNLAEFNILQYGKEKDILYDRLEDTAIPVNSVYVTPHTPEGYIDVVYFSDKKPIDACIEYVRPLGMYVFQNSGVRMNTKSKVVVDARLCNTNDIGISVGPTHVGHYNREDYARIQKNSEYDVFGTNHKRKDVYYRNSDYEEETTPNKSSKWIDPKYRSLYSLQLCNNEHIVKSILPDRIFGLGFDPQNVDYEYPGEYIPDEMEDKNWNLRYDKENEENATNGDTYTVEGGTIIKPEPAVNPVMSTVGDAILIEKNEEDVKLTYTKVDDQGNITKVDITSEDGSNDENEG